MPNPPRRARRPRGSLTRQRVVEAALRLADEEGLEALTMPGLARRLDCGVMTIYGYVDSRDDLLDAIAVAGLADLRLPRPLPAEP
ncbi:MAG TPA: helix-turn-helix domain-containing protein, partial [Ktedonobacterales bacterium]